MANDQLADTQVECESLRPLRSDEILRLVRAEIDRRSEYRGTDRRLTPPPLAE